MLKDFTKEKFDIVIQAGQSNSEGTSFGDVEAPFEPDERIWYLNPDFTVTLAQEDVAGNGVRGNFSLTFAKDYLAQGCLKEGRKLLILRTAVGGTGFSDRQWIPEGPLYLRMLDMIHTARSLNPENRVVALLWHQGETDAINHFGKEAYASHLKYLISGVEDASCFPGIPFVAGDFVRDWKDKNLKDCIPILDALREVCADRNGVFVETGDLESNGQSGFPHPLHWGYDDIHFSRKAIYELGRRYFRAYLSQVK